MNTEVWSFAKTRDKVGLSIEDCHRIAQSRLQISLQNCKNAANEKCIHGRKDYVSRNYC